MRIAAWLDLLPSPFLRRSLLAQKNSCLECHSQARDRASRLPAEGFKQTSISSSGWAARTATAETPPRTMRTWPKTRSFKGAPKRAQVPEFCAPCHSNSAYMQDVQPQLAGGPAQPLLDEPARPAPQKGRYQGRRLHGLPWRPRHPDGQVSQIHDVPLEHPPDLRPLPRRRRTHERLQDPDQPAR